MPATFNRVHNWPTDEIIKTSDLNAEFNNILNNLDPSGIGGWSQTVAQMQLTTSPGTVGAESLATALSGEIQRLRFMIQAIMGLSATEWYSTPVTDLTQIKAALGANLVTSKIISGPTSQFSSSSRFLLPGNSTPTVTVLGQTAAVAFAINGANYTISTNMVVGPLTLAPNANAIVHNAALIGQELSKWVGEDNTTLAITNASAAITNLIGNYAGFKVVSGANTEYFLGYVQSANAITNCLRGFFFNGTGSLTPVDRIPISNGNTISLCKLTWLYGTTASGVGVGYTPPAISNGTPSSPAIGDYWYNLSTQVWMTYNSSTWVTASATLLGVCLQDTANTIAARSFDAYESALPYSNIILQTNSTNSVIAQNYGSKIGVGTNLIDFRNTRPIWSSGAMDPNFGTAFSASGTYWAYVGEMGQLFLSYEKPYQSQSNGQGWYHPYETWRAVGSIQTDVNTAFQAATLFNYPLDANSTAASGGSSYNFLVNSAFDFWQAVSTVSSVTATTAAGVSAYGPDQWYAVNNLRNTTATGIIQMSQQNGSLVGSLFALEATITGTPSGVPASTATSVEIGQSLPPETSFNLDGQTASFGIWVKATGNVNQIGLSFMYSGGTASRTMTGGTHSTAIGTEALFTVNSTAYTLCVLSGQSLGSARGTGGNYGIRIRANGVSGGNNYDVGNGFFVEKGQWNIGPTIGTWQRQAQSIEKELIACQTFFERSYPTMPLVNPSIGPFAPGSTCTQGYAFLYTGGGSSLFGEITYKVQKRSIPAITFYSTNATAGIVDTVVNNTSAFAITVGTSSSLPNMSITASDYGFLCFAGSAVPTSGVFGVIFQWTADARI